LFVYTIIRNIKLSGSHNNCTKRRRNEKRRCSDRAKTIVEAKDFVKSKDLRSQKIGQKVEVIAKSEKHSESAS